MSCWDGGYPDLPEAEREAAWEPTEDDAWRGDRHLADWPEELCGPEYWFFRREAQDGRPG